MIMALLIGILDGAILFAALLSGFWTRAERTFVIAGTIALYLCVAFHIGSACGWLDRSASAENFDKALAQMTNTTIRIHDKRLEQCLEQLEKDTEEGIDGPRPL